MSYIKYNVFDSSLYDIRNYKLLLKNIFLECFFIYDSITENKDLIH
jgi:hypothetical protein